MADIARLAIERPLYSWLLVVVLLLGGVWGLNNVGRLEDPKSPINRALIVTAYNGASAVEVEQEVSEVLEASIQRLPHFDTIVSKSLNGRSEITIDVLDSIRPEDTPQVWDELRRRVSDAQIRLPPGAGPSIVFDDFGDIYGLMYAVATPGYSDRDIRDIGHRLETAVKSVPGIAQVTIDGTPQEAIYIEIDHPRLIRLGLSIDSVFQQIAVENQVIPAGSVLVSGRRLRVAPSMAYSSVEALQNLSIGLPGTSEIVRLGDIARVARERVEVPFEMIRHNGQSVFTIGLSVTKGQNVVDVGKAAEIEIAKQLRNLPIGVTIEPIYAQHTEVEKSISTFLRNLVLSVSTVVLSLCLFMGWRAGTVVGIVLGLSVMGSFLFMQLFDIQLQRISLGALMIAMGMLVDNGIVVAEGMVVGVKQGLQPSVAAQRVVQRTKFPLLGATIIGIAAFGPIGLSNDGSGHFLRSLFQVIAIALSLSWILAITVIPLIGSRLLKPTTAADEAAIYSGVLFAPYRVLLGTSLRKYWRATICLCAILCVCFWAFQFVKPGFFPSTNAPLIYVDYWLPEGTDISTTNEAVTRLESDIQELIDTEAITSFVGRGANRFTAIMNPQQPNSSYAQIVIRIPDHTKLGLFIDQLSSDLVPNHPDAELRVFRAAFTPGTGLKIEARFSGSSPAVLRTLTEQALAIYTKHNLIHRSNDWRQGALTLVPEFDAIRATTAGITRRDLAQALAFSSEGVNVGLYRDNDKLLPIVARAPRSERTDSRGLAERMVYSPGQQRYISVGQIVPNFNVEAQNTVIIRRDRVRTMTARANPPPGYNALLSTNTVKPEIDAIELPPGYSLEWGGEFEGSQRALASLQPGILLAVLAMFTLTLLLFGTVTQPVVIWLTLPMILCGVVIGLVATDSSFTFPAFLGFLSLIGMLIKNCIVLIDEIDKRIQESGASEQTILLASVSRLRPVLLATGTTIIGMTPLLADTFFKEMAICIMSGLAFATVLTLIAVPVFYRIALRKRILQETANDTPDSPAPAETFPSASFRAS